MELCRGARHGRDLCPGRYPQEHHHHDGRYCHRRNCRGGLDNCRFHCATDGKGGSFCPGRGRRRPDPDPRGNDQRRGRGSGQRPESHGHKFEGDGGQSAGHLRAGRLGRRRNFRELGSTDEGGALPGFGHRRDLQHHGADGGLHPVGGDQCGCSCLQRRGSLLLGPGTGGLQ